MVLYSTADACNLDHTSHCGCWLQATQARVSLTRLYEMLSAEEIDPEDHQQQQNDGKLGKPL